MTDEEKEQAMREQMESDCAVLCELCSKRFPVHTYCPDMGSIPYRYVWVHIVRGVEKYKVHHPEHKGTCGEWEWETKVDEDGQLHEVQCKAASIRERFARKFRK